MLAADKGGPIVGRTEQDVDTDYKHKKEKLLKKNNELLESYIEKDNAVKENRKEVKDLYEQHKS